MTPIRARPLSLTAIIKGPAFRLAAALAILAAAALAGPAAAGPQPAGQQPAGQAAATPSLAAPTGSPAGALTPGAPLTGTAPAPTATVALTAPPPVTVTPGPTATATPNAIYPPVAKTTGVPRFEAGPCNFNLPSGAVEGKDVKCGTLIVLEEHADPGSPTLQLAVAIVPSNGSRPLPDPIVFNQGGPGFGSIDTYLPFMLKSPFRGRRDQIAFDQRGTGHSNPALLCPEIINETIATLNINLSPADSDAKYNEAALLCRDRLVHQGVNLSAYNSQENAADIDDLRQALGYQQLNLYGVSYGSLLVLDTLRLFPQGVRSALVDGVVPPQNNMNTDAPRSEDRDFTELFNACTADTACSTTYPNLSDTFFGLVAKLNKEPAHITLTDPDTGQVYPAVLNGDGLIGAIFQAMYESDLIPAIPEIIRRANQGDFGPLEPIIALIDLDRSWSVGIYWSVYCAEDANYDPAKVTYPGVRPELLDGQDANNRAVKSLCQAWNVRDLSSTLNTPVTSTVPTLLFNGRFDPIAPPSNGVEAAQTLTNSIVITFPTTAHGAYPAGGPCVTDIMTAFLNNPGAPVDQRCILSMPPLTFDTPGNMVNFSVLDLIYSALQRRLNVVLGVLAVLLATLALLSGLLLFPIAWVLKARSGGADDAAGLDPSAIAGSDPAALAGAASAMAAGPPKPPEVNAGMLLGLAPWLAVLCGLLPVAFAVALFLTVGPLVQSNNGILLLGLPGSLTWVFLLPLINAGLAFLLLVGTFLGLFSRDWSGRRKLYFLFLSLASIVLVVGLGLLGTLTALWGQALALAHGILPF